MAHVPQSFVPSPPVQLATLSHAHLMLVAVVATARVLVAGGIDVNVVAAPAVVMVLPLADIPLTRA